MMPLQVLALALMVVGSKASPGPMTLNMDMKCFVPGECYDSHIIDLTLKASPVECLSFCRSVSECDWFTYHPTTQVCTALHGCIKLDDEPCKECISGQVDCPEFECGVDGRCLGALEGIRGVADEGLCKDECLKDPKCLWFTFDFSEQSCVMVNDCHRTQTDCGDCKHWQRECFEGGTVAGTSSTPGEDDSGNDGGAFF